VTPSRRWSRHVAVAADGASCAPTPGLVQPAAPGHATVVVVVQYACPAPPRSLWLDDRLFMALGRDHHTIANVEWTGGSQQLVFDPERPHAVVPIATASAGAGPAPVSGATAFFRFGVEHILTGFDHILFLLALVLGGGSLKALLGIVTAFTVAHSTTLALAVFDVARPPEWLIEPLIALSIAVVAVENLVAQPAPFRRALASFAFGLVHGFGFAGALLELHLPTETLIPSLLLFNLGVEAGQAVIVALLLPLLAWSSWLLGRRRVIGSVSAVVLTAALALFVGRL
jgi:HupE / UreJ protein